MLKVVVHVDETAKWPVTVANVENLIRDVDLREVLGQLGGKGRNRGLPSFVKVVPAGITELVRRQHDGWACVRP